MILNIYSLDKCVTKAVETRSVVAEVLKVNYVNNPGDPFV